MLGTLSREIHEENYASTLAVLKIMKNSTGSEDKINGTIDNLYKILLLQTLKVASVKKMDPHIMLEWLDAGDRLFCNSIPRENYAILKLYFLCQNRKLKLECFSCGCVQKYFIKLYTEDENTRLIAALNSLITSKSMNLNPIIERIYNSLPKISSIDYFEYYTELLGELENCSVIDGADSNMKLKRLIQLIGILCELRQADVPKACSNLYALIRLSKYDEIKRDLIIPIILRNKLLPKIFDSIMSSGCNTTLLSDRNSVQKMAELVKNEKYSYAKQASALFSPLQLLNQIYSEFDAWESSSITSLIKNRLNELKMESSEATISFFYFISLIYRNEPSLVDNLVDYLKLQFQNSTTISVKVTILYILEVIEILAGPNSSFHPYIKENNPKTGLILDSELEIVLDYIQGFSSLEIHRFLQKRKFSDDEHSMLMKQLKNLKIYVNNDEFWKVLLKKVDGDSVIFIENQLRILMNRQNQKSINQRIEQIFVRILPKETMDFQKDIENIEMLLLKFPQVLLNLSDSDYKLLPPTTTISLASTLIFGFAAVLEGNESKITTLFRRLHSKLNPTSPISDQEPLEIIEDIAEKIRSKQLSGDLKIGFLKEVYSMKPENATKKERIAQVSSILFEKLAGVFQKLGDANGNSPFCQLATIIDEFVKKTGEVVPNYQIRRSVCERAMEGFAIGAEKWNWLFLRRKILAVLSSAEQDHELMERLMRILNKNEMSEDGELKDSPNTESLNDDLFTIDRNHSGIIPNEDIHDLEVGDEHSNTPDGTSKTAEGESTPSEWMKQMRKRMLEPADAVTGESPEPKRRRVNLCFNCRGEHSISQCPEPKDFQAIRKNKQEFLNDKQQSAGNGGRISKITSEKEEKFKPGRLSQKLRDALNLGPDDIPEWVYRMRRMGFHRGYPPGYLRKSLKKEFETLKIFSEDSKKSDEIDDEKLPAPSVQTEKVHFYMGFNKSYRALRDRENGKFEVPPFDVFCEMLQTEVSRDHEHSEKSRLRENSLRRSELQKKREEEKLKGSQEEEDDDDGFVVDRKKTEDSEEKGDAVDISDEEEETREKTPVRDEKMVRLVVFRKKPQFFQGESIHQLIGTPIISRRDANGSWISETTPSLEAFAVGIVPFEAKEEEQKRGIFKKIMSKLRGKTEGEEK
ncbi:hypothetical protein CRE_03943 [Caenorhabditis remanei]|uniref:PSP proline-rich domain-containing protein n=1 Tax=Caenorhabditis remanei TaxID=31234 RepID=E3LXZ9_CAERE|nr:hypothetical protein CRE_03943 [Caenorhabditis remanei]